MREVSTSMARTGAAPIGRPLPSPAVDEEVADDPSPSVPHGIHRRRRDRRPRGRARGALAGAEGGAPAGRAPAPAQGPRLPPLQWAHFVAAADALFDAQAKEFGKQAGVEIAIERINQNDIQARVTAAVQSGAGPDI